MFVSAEDEQRCGCFGNKGSQTRIQPTSEQKAKKFANVFANTNNSNQSQDNEPEEKPEKKPEVKVEKKTSFKVEDKSQYAYSNTDDDVHSKYDPKY